MLDKLNMIIGAFFTRCGTDVLGCIARLDADYQRHLQTQYPFLFSLAVRTNPLDPEASVTVIE